MLKRLTVLCENSVGKSVQAIGEHGFSCFVETPDSNYLLDTGQGFGIVQNSLVLSRDLRSINATWIQCDRLIGVTEGEC